MDREKPNVSFAVGGINRLDNNNNNAKTTAPTSILINNDNNNNNGGVGGGNQTNNLNNLSSLLMNKPSPPKNHTSNPLYNPALVPQNFTSTINNIANSAPPKKKTYYDLDSQDLYYILLSDNLAIDQEKFIVYFLYKYIIDKSDDTISMLASTIRVSYVELGKLFNMARDHMNIRANVLFKAKLECEIDRRMRNALSWEKKRKFYSDDLYKNWNFVTDLLMWLIESDHHNGYKVKVEELKKAVIEKENVNKINDEKLQKLSLELKRTQDSLRNVVNEDGLKKRKLNESVVTDYNAIIGGSLSSYNTNPLLYNNSDNGVVEKLAAGITSIKNNCNIF
jgi:hypothetical protein